MTTLIAVAVFALGVQLAIRTLAAFYRIIDLWYAIGTAYPRVLRGILGWGGVTIAMALLLSEERRSSFVHGLLGFVGFYLALYVVRHVLVRRREPSLRAPLGR